MTYRLVPDLTRPLNPSDVLMGRLMSGHDPVAVQRVLAGIGLRLPPDHEFNRRLRAFATRANGLDLSDYRMMHDNVFFNMLFGSELMIAYGQENQGLAMYTSNSEISVMRGQANSASVLREWMNHTGGISPMEGPLRRQAARFLPSLGAG